MKSRLIVACFIIGGLLTGAFAPAAPSLDKDVLKEQVDWRDFHDYGCGFLIEVRTTGTVTMRTTLDRNGNVVRYSVSWTGAKRTWTNMSNGKSVWSPFATIERDGYFAKGTRLIQWTSGLGNRIVVPGKGLISADVGRAATTVYLSSTGHPTSLSVKSQWPGMHPPDGQAQQSVFCEVLR
jgi:hypothetical protein